MATIGERLQQERKRLGLNQTDFGVACGGSKASQIRYEADERSPDGNYLARAMAIGADVLFILSGRKTPLGVTEPESSVAYTPAELAAAAIRPLKLSEEDAAMVRALAERLAREN